MPASLPGSTAAENLANPSAGPVVIGSPLTFSKGAPLDTARNADGSGCGSPTGLGFGASASSQIGLTAPASIDAAGFDDDYVPGLTMPNGTNAPDSRLFVIGGGRTNADGSPGTPWSAGSGLLAAGNGGSRDGGVAGTGFNLKTVTATSPVANGGVVESGYVNRSGATLPTGFSTFGSATAASTVPT